MWRYVGFSDLLQYFWAALGSLALMAGAVFILEELGRVHGLASIIFVFFALFLLVGLIASRSSFRILDTLFARHKREVDERVMILGAGDAGEMALRWMQMNPQLHYHPVGIVDTDPFMTGRVIHGIEVLGGPQDLEELLTRKQAQGLVIAGVDTEQIALDQVIDACRVHGCWVRRLRLEFESLDES